MTTVNNLDTPLINFADNSGSTAWTIRDAVEGVQIFGGIGSGKTSGSGRMLALKYLTNGFGGLVLTAKPDEKENWIEYCRLTGRSNDLIVFEPGSHSFNFLDYESRQQVDGRPITENLMQVLKTVIRASEEKSGGKSDDPFWESALDMLIFHVIDLCSLAYGRVSVDLLYQIAQTAPKRAEATEGMNAYKAAFEAAQRKVSAQVDVLESSLSVEQKAHLDEVSFETLIIDAIPDAALLKQIDQFFMETYRNLSEKTRSIIEFSFSGFLFRLMKEPVYSLFCRHHSTFEPEDSLDGKIILVNLPVKQYHKVGRDSQVLFKYIWQRAMERRDVRINDRPVFLYADEAQHFIHEYDSEYQATARSSRIATVYITQNLANYHANMGGNKSEYRVKSFLGTLGTKIFHANADTETNKYASELIGEGYTMDMSVNESRAGKFSFGENRSFKLERMVRPEQFTGLKTGSPANAYRVEAYVHLQGKVFHDGNSHRKIVFQQT